MPPPRTTAPKALIPAPARRPKPAIRSRSCFCRRAIAPRFKAASSRHRDGDRRMSSAVGSRASLIPAKAGIGLRFQHHHAVVEMRPDIAWMDIAWMEVHTENYMGGGPPL